MKQFPTHLYEIPNYVNHIKSWSRQHQAVVSTIVNQLVRKLHKLPHYSIKEPIKGGSVGKGTAMQYGSDIDLIVFFNGYSSIEDFIFHKQQIILDIFNYFNNRYIHQFKYMSIVRYDEYLLKYKIKPSKAKRYFYVDILPAMQVVRDHYLPTDLFPVYREMEFKPDNVRNHYSTCFSKVQRDMVQNKPDDVRDLILLLKDWKNIYHVPIKSYCCEVIGLFVHHTCFYEAESFDVGDAFLEAMRLLSYYKTLQIVLPFYYKINRWKRHFPNEPYILDPVNPFSDTTDTSLDDCDQVEIEKCARIKFKELKSGNEYQPVSIVLDDKTTTKLNPKPQWPQTIKSGQQTQGEQLLEEGGLAANRTKRPPDCEKCFLLCLAPCIAVIMVFVFLIIVYVFLNWAENARK